MEKNELVKIGLGGGCHWCTEAVFQNIMGVHRVDQGFVSSIGEEIQFSEAVVIYFDAAVTGLKDLIKVHLKTHSSSSNHSMRKKYRSAVYVFSKSQEREVSNIITDLMEEHPEGLITKVLPFRKFEPSKKEFINYYMTWPGRPFCRKYIEPKLEIIKKEFPGDFK